MLDVEFAQYTDPGKVRDHNEDCYGYFVPASPEQARSHGWLFVLADGVGGQDRGEVASQTAVETIVKDFPRASASDSMAAMMTRLVQSANTRIIEAGLSVGTGKSRMATTVVACALRYDRLLVAHAGDSRCYLVRAGKAIQITRDHTVVNEQIRLGVLTSGEADSANTRHLLSRSLGNDLFVNVETTEQQILPGDALLLCSDGLHNSVGGDDIAAALRPSAALDEAARSLVALAKRRDGGDNISVQVIRVRDVQRVGMYRGRPYKLR